LASNLLNKKKPIGIRFTSNQVFIKFRSFLGLKGFTKKLYNPNNNYNYLILYLYCKVIKICVLKTINCKLEIVW